MKVKVRECNANKHVHRGTASALTFSCYANATERASANAILNQLGSGNSSNAQLGKTWAWASNFADTCSENASDEGSLISTAFVARDMMQIVDALDEDGLLRYWGKRKHNPMK